MKRYIVTRCMGNPAVEILVGRHSARTRALRPERSLHLANHSPDGFEWGYGGSGPAQLALAILLDFTGSSQMALRFYQPFKERFIAGLAHDRWEIRSSQIRDFLAAELAAARKIDASIFASKSGEKCAPFTQKPDARMNILGGFGSNR